MMGNQRKTYVRPRMETVKLESGSEVLVGSKLTVPSKAKIDNYEDGEFSW